MYWIRRRTGRDNPIHTSHNQANFLANFKRSLMLTVQLEYLFQAAQDARLVHSRHQVPAVLTFNPATTLGSNIVPDLIQIPPPSDIQAYRCLAPAMDLAIEVSDRS